MTEVLIRDPLTGAHNKRKFEEVLEYELTRAKRHHQVFSIIMAHIDNFKLINDTYGHQVGDIALKKLTVLLESCLRKGDLLARLDGNEFAIILPGITGTNALQAADKLHQILDGEKIELPIGNIKLAASFGVVSYPDDGNNMAELQAAMNTALHQEKAQRGNQIATTPSEPNNSVKNIFQQGDFLRRALQDNRVEAFLQPIVHLQSGHIFSYEVLARIREGEHVIAAENFIQAAENLGMIREVDQRVFQQGLQRTSRMLDELHYSPTKMFFNLSARTFGDTEWMLSIPDQLMQLNVPCDRIVIEITEREALPHLHQVKAIIDELRHQGIAFALDDFGSGFSSFLYLKHLAMDYVKIEGSFVRQIAVDKRDRIMVTHMHQMAQELGLKTIAELVEDEETAKILTEIGVDYAQGFYYGHPAIGAD